LHNPGQKRRITLFDASFGTPQRKAREHLTLVWVERRFGVIMILCQSVRGYAGLSFENAQKLLTYTRVAFALFIILFVMSWQRTGPPDWFKLLSIASICLVFVLIIHIALWSIDVALRVAHWLAHHGRDRRTVDASGALVGRYTPLFRIVLPLSLVAFAGALAGGPGMYFASGPNAAPPQMLMGFGLFFASAATLYAATYLMSFRYRMDDTGIEISKMLLARSYNRWSDLKAVGTGPLAGDIVLVFGNGQCARIPRYSEGHEVIADYALERMRHA
jgi:hypothetical protein